MHLKMSVVHSLSKSFLLLFLELVGLQVSLKSFLSIASSLRNGRLSHSLGAAFENALTRDTKTRLDRGPQMMHRKVSRGS